MLDSTPDLTGRIPGDYVYWTDQFGQQVLCRVLEISTVKGQAQKLRLSLPCGNWVNWFEVEPAEEICQPRP